MADLDRIALLAVGLYFLVSAVVAFRRIFREEPIHVHCANGVVVAAKGDHRVTHSVRDGSVKAESVVGIYSRDGFSVAEWVSVEQDQMPHGVYDELLSVCKKCKGIAGGN